MEVVDLGGRQGVTLALPLHQVSQPGVHVTVNDVLDTLYEPIEGKMRQRKFEKEVRRKLADGTLVKHAERLKGELENVFESYLEKKEQKGGRFKSLGNLKKLTTKRMKVSDFKRAITKVQRDGTATDEQKTALSTARSMLVEACAASNPRKAKKSGYHSYYCKK